MSQKFLSDVTLSTVTGGSMLKLDANGKIVAAVDGTDYISTSASSLWSTASGGIFYSDDVRIGTYQADVAPDAKLHIFDYQTTTPKLLIEDGNTGDASMEFKISTQSFTMGIDNSDSDKFVIAASGGLGTSNVLEIATSGLSAFQNSVLVKGSLFINNQEQIQQGATEKIASFQNLGTERGYFEVTDTGKGYFVADGFKTATASTGFLKADGSVDTGSFFSGAYADLTGKPTLGTMAAANTNDYKTSDEVETYVAGELVYTNISGTPTLGTAAAADTTDFATAAQGALADSALQSLPTHYHDGRYYTKTESDNKYAVNGNNLVPINATDSNYQLFTEEVILATVNEYRGLAFPNGGRNFVFEVSIKGNISANHQGIFWGLNTLESIYNNNESGYKLTHQGEGQFHIRDIATNANQATSQDVLYAPNDGQYHRYKIISYTDPSNSNKAFFKVYVDGTLVFNAPQFAAPPQVPTYFGFINYTGDVTFSNWNVREITGEDELALLYGDGVFQPAGNYLTSLPAHHHDARYYTETEMDTFLAGKLSTSGGVLSGALNVLYTDSPTGTGWDKNLFIGTSDDLGLAGAFPTYVPSGSYGFFSHANSDGVFIGSVPTAAGSSNYYATIAWGDDSTEYLQFLYKGTQVAYLETDGDFYIDGSFYSGTSKIATETFASGEAQAVQDNLDTVVGSLGSNAYTSYTDHTGLYDTVGSAAAEAGAVQDNLDSLATSLGTAAFTASTDYQAAGNYADGTTYQTYGTGNNGWLMPDYNNNTSNFMRMYYDDGSREFRMYSYHGAAGESKIALYDGVAFNTLSSTNIAEFKTAYGWGNHASAGYLTSIPSHNHDDRYYTESESDSRFLNTSGDTATGLMTFSAGIDYEYAFYQGYAWYKRFYVRSVGLTGSAIANSWVLLGIVRNENTYERTDVKFRIRGYDDVSSGTEIIQLRVENHSTAQEIHQLYWYADDATPNLFREVKSVIAQADGLANTYFLWVKMVGDWTDTFTVEAEVFNSHSRPFEFDDVTVIPEGGAPEVPVSDITKTERVWYTSNASIHTNGGRLATESFVTGQGYLTSVPSSYATTSYVDTAVSNLVDSAPSTLDTLNELAAALGDDPNFATTVTNSIATKLPISGGTLTGDLTIDNNTPRIDFKADQSGANVGGRIELNENGNLWVNAQGGKDLWLNWLSPTSPASKADLQVGDGNSGGAILTVQGSTRRVGINKTAPTQALDVSGNIVASGTLSASGYNNSNWDTAYGWGNHADAGYLTSIPSTYATDAEVNTAVGAIDTRINDEVIPYIAAVETTANAALPKSGGTISGSLTIGAGVTLSESTDRVDLLYINSSTSGWGGLQIGNTSNEFIFSLMGNGNAGGIYDDQNGDWIIYWDENAGVQLYHNSNTKLLTVSDGVNITGRLYASSGIQVPYGAGEHRPMVVLNGATNYGLFHTEATNDKFTFDFNGDQKFQFSQDGIFTINGNTITTGKVTNWDTAHGWGDHSAAGYASAGFLTNSAGAKLEIQNGTDGGTEKGIYMWQTSDPNWVIYMAQAGTGKSAAGGNAVEGFDGATGHAIRFRVNNNAEQAGFIWENSSEEALMQLNGGTKNLYVAGRVYTGGGNSGQWDTAVSWGNHADAGYLTSATAATTYQPLGNYFTDGDTVLNMANNDGLVYNDTNNTMYIKKDGTNYAIIDSGGGTMSGQLTASGGINMSNTNITNVNHITINDAGYGEGVQWSNWMIYDSPDDLSNQAGNFQISSVADPTIRVTVDPSGNLYPSRDRLHALGLETNRWQIVFCEILDSAGQHEKNLQNPEGEKSVGEYETGTVLVWKGGKNVPCTTAADHMRMGIAVKGIDSPLIQGAEPVLVTGAVKEGDYLVTSSKKEGHAEAISPEFMRQHNLFDCVLGKALESAEGESHLVKTWINI